MDLLLCINGVEDVLLTTELAAAGDTFPVISAQLFKLGGPEVCPGCCLDLLELRAEPVQEEGVRFFVRGDSNDDGRSDISDVISILRFLFLDGSTPTCLDAADVNDDGGIDISDPVALLASLFLGETLPAVPSCFCGPDTTSDALGCEGQSSCTGADETGEGE